MRLLRVTTTAAALLAALAAAYVAINHPGNHFFPGTNLCVGLDCISGVEGYDGTLNEIRMKENNVMMQWFINQKDEKNSTSIRWRCNESTNGGRNAFLVEARHRNVPYPEAGPASSPPTPNPAYGGALHPSYFEDCYAALSAIHPTYPTPTCQNVGIQTSFDIETREHCCWDYPDCGFSNPGTQFCNTLFPAPDPVVCAPWKVCATNKIAVTRQFEIDSSESVTNGDVTSVFIAGDGSLLLPASSTTVNAEAAADESEALAVLNAIVVSDIYLDDNERHVGPSAENWHVATSNYMTYNRPDDRTQAKHIALYSAIGWFYALLVESWVKSDAYFSDMRSRLTSPFQNQYVVEELVVASFDASTAVSDLLSNIPALYVSGELAEYFSIRKGATFKMEKVASMAADAEISFLSPLLFRLTTGFGGETVLIESSTKVKYGFGSDELFECPAGTYLSGSICALCPAGFSCLGEDSSTKYGWKPIDDRQPCLPGYWCPSGSYYGNKCGSWGFKSENVASVDRKSETACVLTECDPLDECRAGTTVPDRALDVSLEYDSDTNGYVFATNVAYPFEKAAEIVITNVADRAITVDVSKLISGAPTLPAFVESTYASVPTVNLNPGDVLTFPYNFVSSLAPGVDAIFAVEFEWHFASNPSEVRVVPISGVLDVISLIVRPEEIEADIYAGDVVEDAFELFNIGCNYSMAFNFSLGCESHSYEKLSSWLSITETTTTEGVLEAGAGRPQRFNYVIDTTNLPYKPDGVSYEGCFTLISTLLPIGRVIPYDVPVKVRPYRECEAGTVSGSGLTTGNCQSCPLNFYQDEIGKTACVECPDAFPATLSVGTASSEDCQPEVGFYRGPNGEEQVPCNERAMNCRAAGLKLTTLPLNSGWWRTGSQSIELLECPRKQYCLGGADASQYCAPHHTGPFCFACEPGFRRKGPERLCTECDPTTLSNDRLAGGLLVGGITFAFLAMLVGYVYYRRRYFHRRELQRAQRAEERKRIIMELASAKLTKRGGRRHSVEALFAIEMDEIDSKDSEFSKLNKAIDLSVKLRVMVGLTQVISGVAEQFFDDFPPAFHELADMFAVVSVDLFGLVDFGCLVPDSNHFVSLLVATIAPFLFSVLLLIVHLCVERAVKSAKNPELVNEMRSATFTVWLILLFLVYPGVSATVFRMFVCDDFDDGRSALRVDYSISCLTDEYKFYRTYAGVMVFFYPVGIVLVYAISLYLFRDRLRTSDAAWGISFDPLVSKTRDEDPKLAHLRFLYAPYKPSYYAYEVFELLRKLAQTSLIAFWAPGTATQIIIQLGVTAAVIAVLYETMPYVDPHDNLLAILVQWAILFVCFIALLNRVELSAGSSEYDQLFFDIAVVGVVVLPLAYALYVVGLNAYEGFFEWRDNRRTRRERAAERIIKDTRNLASDRKMTDTDAVFEALGSNEDGLAGERSQASKLHKDIDRLRRQLQSDAKKLDVEIARIQAAVARQEPMKAARVVKRKRATLAKSAIVLDKLEEIKAVTEQVHTHDPSLVPPPTRYQVLKSSFEDWLDKTWHYLENVNPITKRIIFVLEWPFKKTPFHPTRAQKELMIGIVAMTFAAFLFSVLFALRKRREVLGE